MIPVSRNLDAYLLSNQRHPLMLLSPFVVSYSPSLSCLYVWEQIQKLPLVPQLVVGGNGNCERVSQLDYPCLNLQWQLAEQTVCPWKLPKDQRTAEGDMMTLS